MVSVGLLLLHTLVGICAASYIEAHATIFNNGGRALILHNMNVSHGVWVTNPPQRLEAHSSAAFRTDSDGFMTGTEGWMTWVPEGSSAWITIHWDLPFSGTNTCESLFSRGTPSYAACNISQGRYPDMLSFWVVDRTPPEQFLLFGHAGSPLTNCENTMAAFTTAVYAGANALELDLSVTQDNVVVVWHDWDPNDAQALARQAGGEGYLCRPWVPDKGDTWRRTVPQLLLADFLVHYGYTEVPFTQAEECKAACSDQACKDACVPRTADIVPTFEQFVAKFAVLPQVQHVFLDTKMPQGSDPAFTNTFMTQAWGILTQYGGEALAQKCLWSSPYPDVHATMRAWFSANHPEMLPRTVFDSQIPPGVVTSPLQYSSMDVAVPEGNCFGGLGKPVITLDGWSIFMEIIRHDLWRRALNNIQPNMYCGGSHLIIWTINDPTQLQEVINQYPVDGLLTDCIDVARRILNTTYTASPGAPMIAGPVLRRAMP